jgi:hypothetical protein
MPSHSQNHPNHPTVPASSPKKREMGSAGEPVKPTVKLPVRPAPKDSFDSIIDTTISANSGNASAKPSQRPDSPAQPTEETGAQKKPDKVRAKWELATFGKSARSVTIEEHVKNLTSPRQELRRASAEILRFSDSEVLRPISKLLLHVATNDPDQWTASYAYRAYLRQLKEKELKIYPEGKPGEALNFSKKG